IVLVRRIARPVAGGRVDLDNEDPLRREVRLHDVGDLPCCVAGATDLDLDFLRRNRPWLTSSLSACAAESELGVALERDTRVSRQVERARQRVEHVRSTADLPFRAFCT